MTDPDEVRVAEWLDTGELEVGGMGAQPTFQEVCDRAAPLLDSACASDITGVVLFTGTDGEYYAGTVEFTINRANPDYVRQVLDALDALAADNDD